MAVRERGSSDVREMAKLVPELGERYRETFDRLTGRFRARGLSGEDAADLAQETIMLTLSHIRRHGLQQADLKPLINTIAKNLVVERFRSGGRELAVPIEEWVLRDGQDVGEEVAKSERAKLVHAAINEIPARQRTAVLMALEGVGPIDIAQRLGIKRNAVDALLHRARKQLATRLEDCRDAAWGSSAVVWLRLRLRRTSWTLRSPDAPLSAIAPAIVALGAVIAISVAPGTGGVGDASKRPTPHAGATAARAPGFERTGAVRDAHPDRVRSTSPKPPPDAGVRLGRNPKVVIATEARDPVTGEKGPVILGVTHDPNDDNGRLTPVFNLMFDTTCERAPQLCEEE